VTPDNPDFGEPHRDEPSASEGSGEQPLNAGRSAEYPRQAHEGPAPAGSRMMPNDYPFYQPYPPFPPDQPIRPRRRTPAWVKVLGGCLGAVLLLGALFACAISFAAAALFHSSPDATTSTQTFAVDGTPTVRIHSTAGNIHVVPGDAGTVTVQATRYGRGFSSDDAQNAVRQITVGVTRSGNTLNIQVNEPNGGDGIHFWDNRHVDLTVTVPEQANIAATLSAGNVDARGITGTIGIQNDAGNLSLDDVTLGGSSFAIDTAGNIDISGALQPGASLEARTNAGNVTATLPRATSAHLTASTTAGNVDVDATWPVSVTRQFGHGSASGDLNPHPTGSLVLETNAGNVTLDAGA
jgi:Putative adhesin